MKFPSPPVTFNKPTTGGALITGSANEFICRKISKQYSDSGYTDRLLSNYRDGTASYPFVYDDTTDYVSAIGCDSMIAMGTVDGSGYTELIVQSRQPRFSLCMGIEHDYTAGAVAIAPPWVYTTHCKSDQPKVSQYHDFNLNWRQDIVQGTSNQYTTPAGKLQSGYSYSRGSSPTSGRSSITLDNVLSALPSGMSVYMQSCNGTASPTSKSFVTTGAAYENFVEMKWSQAASLGVGYRDLGVPNSGMSSPSGTKPVLLFHVSFNQNLTAPRADETLFFTVRLNTSGTFLMYKFKVIFKFLHT